ncbi:MAG: HAD family hydrolase [Chloroflexota bacterium]|nr:MAG: HAD family hydrolase [Chloroflexota bacterium]
MAAIRAVLFDLYDTLAWADGAILDAGRAEIALRAGIDPIAFLDDLRVTEPARFRGELGSDEEQLTTVLRSCGARLTPSEIHELALLERATWRRGVTLYDDALDHLQASRRRGFRLALVSNCAAQSALWIADQRLDREVDHVVLSCDVGSMKPEPAIFRAALERIDVAPDEALFVDDRAGHLDAARELGLQTVLIARGATRIPPTGHLTIGALADLMAML